MSEKWKSLAIINCSRYSVSNQGNVFDFKYNMNMPLKHRVDTGGYIRVPLVTDEGKNISIAVHRLVMIAFNYREDYKTLEVDHLNCDRLDNRLENLRWVTHKENMNNPITKQRLKRKQKRNDYSELHEYRSRVAKENAKKRYPKWKSSYEKFKNDSERYNIYAKKVSDSVKAAKLKRYEKLAELYDLHKTLSANQLSILEKTGHKYRLSTLAKIRDFKNPNHERYKHAK